MTKTSREPEYEPAQAPLGVAVADIDLELRNKLTNKNTVEDLAARLRAEAFVFDADDAMLMATATDLKVVDDDEYVRGYELLNELGDLDTRITTRYAVFDKPLAFLTKVVQSCRLPQQKEVAAIKKALSTRLGLFKNKKDAQARLEAEARQAATDRIARETQDARADALERVAEAEANPDLAESFRREAESVRSADVHSAPVDIGPSTPAVSGYTKKYWSCEFVDVKELMRAYVEGRCFLDEEAIKAGLQASLDKQAESLTTNMGKAFPGTRATYRTTAVPRRRS